MKEGNASQEFRLTNIEEIKNIFIKEIYQNEKISIISNYIEHFLISASAITGYVSISRFASLIIIPIEITGSIGLKICAIIAAIKKYKSIIKKKKKT